VFDEALLALRRSGGLTPRQVQPAPALVEARRGVNSLMMKWDDTLIDRLAAMNLFLDRSKERRRAEFSKVRESVGACRERPGFLYSENALRGDWVLECERGLVQVSVTLAPTAHPGIQHLELRALPPNADVAVTSGLPPQACPR
jgi:hypothetical protein